MQVDDITTESPATAWKEQLAISQTQATCKSTTTWTQPLWPEQRERGRGGHILTPTQGWKMSLNDFTMDETGTAVLQPYPAGRWRCDAWLQGAAQQRAVNPFFHRSTVPAARRAQVEVETSRVELSSPRSRDGEQWMLVSLGQGWRSPVWLWPSCPTQSSPRSPAAAGRRQALVTPLK